MVATGRCRSGPKKSWLTINKGSAANKQAELEVFLNYHKIKLLVGTESHLNDSIYSSEIFPKNYSVYRKDRKTVFILVDKSIPSSKLELEFACEVIWVTLHVQGPHNIILGAFYTPQTLRQLYGRIYLNVWYK